MLKKGSRLNDTENEVSTSQKTKRQRSLRPVSEVTKYRKNTA